MIVIKEQTKYYQYAFVYDFDMAVVEFCRSLKEKNGWQEFSFSDKKWRFKDLNIIYDIKDKYPVVLNDDVKFDFEKFELDKKQEELKVKKGEKIKKAVKPELVVRGLKGEPYPFQKIGIEFFIINNGRALLADEPGTGKSLQSLAYIVHERLNRVLVVCPASVKYSWNNETTKWTYLSPFIINGNTKLTIDVLNSYNIFIINYDLLHKFFPILSVTQWDCLILDESHYLKNIKSRRTKLAKKLSINIPKILLLSGTPILNKTYEIFTSLNILNEKIWNNWYYFTNHFCNGHKNKWGYDYSGSSNIEELKSKIASYFLRRTKEDVLPDLPPKTYINLPIELKKEDWNKYKMAEDEFIEYLKNIKKKNKNEIDRSMAAERLVKLNYLRQIASMGKIDSAIEIIENIVSNNKKILVFSAYNEPLKQLYNYFNEQAVLLIGETQNKDRGEIINKFQTDDGCKIFLAGIKAGGVGVTLTSASTVLFLDYSFVPADMIQAEDRVHRPGQTADKIIIYQLNAKNTIDEKMVNILDKKKKIIYELIEGKNVINEEQNSLVNDLIEIYNK